MNTTVWVGDIPWFNRCLRSAQARDLVGPIGKIARAYRENRLAEGDVVTANDLQPESRVRVTRGELTVILSYATVIGYIVGPTSASDEAEARESAPAAMRATAARRKASVDLPRPGALRDVIAFAEANGLGTDVELAIHCDDGAYRGVYRVETGRDCIVLVAP